MSVGKRWTIQDRYGNSIYLTHERWRHIIAPYNHPDMQKFEVYLQTTIQQGYRQQDALNFQKYRYSKSFAKLANDNSHIVAIVLFRFRQENELQVPNNYIVTAYQKEVS